MTDDKRSKTPTIKTLPEMPKVKTGPPMVTADIPSLPPIPGQVPQGSKPPSTPPLGKPAVSLDTDKGLGPPVRSTPPSRKTPEPAREPFVTSPERPIVRRTPITDPLVPRDSMDEAMTAVFDSGQFQRKPQQVSVDTSEDTKSRRPVVELDSDEATNAAAKKPQPQNMLDVMVEDSIRPRPVGESNPFERVRPTPPSDFGTDENLTRPGYLGAGEATKVDPEPGGEAHDTFNMLHAVVDKTGVKAAQPAPDTEQRPVVSGLSAARSAGAGPDSIRPRPMDGPGPDSIRPRPMDGPGPDSIRPADSLGGNTPRPMIVAQSRKAIDDSGNFRREAATPVKAVSRKDADDPRQRANTPPRAIPQVQLRALSDVKGHPQEQQNLGYLAPPRESGEARARRGRELAIWVSIVVMLACVIALVIWFVAK